MSTLCPYIPLLYLKSLVKTGPGDTSGLTSEILVPNLERHRLGAGSYWMLRNISVVNWAAFIAAIAVSPGIFIV